MTKDGHHLIGRQSLTHQMIRVGILVAFAAVQAPAFAQVAHPGVAGAGDLYGAGYAPDISCEPSFHSGECSDYNYCLEIWQNYCYERHPRGSLCQGGCGLFGRLHGLSGCRGSCGNDCGGHCSEPSASASAPIYAPQAAPVQAPVAAPEEAASRTGQPVSPEPPLAPHETAPVTPLQRFPQDLNDAVPPKLEKSQVPPEPGDIPFTPPINDLPKNELPLLPVSVAVTPNSAPLPSAQVQLAYLWQQSSQQPPVPVEMNLGATETIEHSGTLRLVEHINRMTDQP